MARKRKTDAERAVSQAQRTVKEIRKRSKLLKRAQMNVREYRHELAVLKKHGIAARRINVARHHPTRYMMGKLRKFKEVSTGRALAVPISKLPTHRARQYVERGTAKKVGQFLLVPKTAVKQRADVIKGHLATYTSLEYGEERIIFLPYEAKDLNEVIEQLKDHESEINRLKERNEQFGFQLFGHNAKRGFPSVNGDESGLLHYLETKYKHILSNASLSRKAFQHFVLIRFKHAKGFPQMEPYKGQKFYDRKSKKNDPYYQRELLRRQNIRKTNLRAKETPQQKANRLERQRRYDRNKSNERREKRMGKRLLGD